VPADEERLSFVAGGIFDQGEVQPFEALRTSTLAREGSPLDSEHPQRVEGVVILLVGPRRELSGQAMTAVERAGANEGLYAAASILT
jgi:hypothetical protein